VLINIYSVIYFSVEVNHEKFMFWLEMSVCIFKLSQVIWYHKSNIKIYSIKGQTEVCHILQVKPKFCHRRSTKSKTVSIYVIYDLHRLSQSVAMTTNVIFVSLVPAHSMISNCFTRMDCSEHSIRYEIRNPFRAKHNTSMTYFRCILAVSFIYGGNRSTRRKPTTSHWQTFINMK
jgi:hypothetical protein